MKRPVIIHIIYILIIIALLTFTFIQKTISTQMTELANRNAIEAQKNGEEALRQKTLHEENVDEVFRQMKIVEELKAKLEECEKRNKYFDSFEESKKRY